MAGVDVAGLRMRNPVMLAAGLLGSDPDTMRSAYEAGAGAVVTKSITLNPREGGREPRMVPEAGGWLNAVGLANPGVREFARLVGDVQYPLVASLAGTKAPEFAEMIEALDAGGANVSAFEVNLSCPNARGFDVGGDPLLVSRIVEAAKRAAKGRPVFAKVAFHHVLAASMMTMPDGAPVPERIDTTVDGRCHYTWGSNDDALQPEDAVSAAVRAGCGGITAINAVPATAFDAGGAPAFGSPHAGGLSGPPVRPMALRAVCVIRDRYPDVPVIGCGGISSGGDAVRFLGAGASAVQVGSHAMVNGVQVLGEIAGHLDDIGAGGS